MNPFTVRAMIKDREMFFGRENELRDLYTLLNAMQSCSIVGPRRIGKSSLLFHLADPDTYPAFLPDSGPYVFAYLDLQELAGLGPDDFFFTIVERLDRASGGRLEVDPERDGTLSGFRHLLSRATDSDLKLVVCLDEFEMLSQNTSFSVDFFTYLRGLCSNYSLALVTSSRASLYDLCHQGDLQTSQFWNIFIERILGLMTDDEAASLIREPFTYAGVSVNDEDVAFVVNLAGRQPFFIQIACYHLFEAKAADGTVDYAAVERRFTNEAQPHYAYSWERLGNAERNALVELLNKQDGAIAQAPYQNLHRSSLLSGEQDAASLVSDGWRQFITGKIGPSAIDTVVGSSLVEGRAGAPEFPDELTSDSIFISYSRSDWDEFVRPLVLFLREKGFSIWVDQHLLKGGQDWLDMINQAVRVCQRMVLCVSPDAMDSQYVKIEYRAFIGEGKLLVPVICREAELPVELRVIQHIPFDDFEGLVRTLGEA